MTVWPVDSTACPDCNAIGEHACRAVRSHFAQAESLIAEASVSGQQTADRLIARAHVHALLAVAEATGVRENKRRAA